MKVEKFQVVRKARFTGCEATTIKGIAKYIFNHDLKKRIME